MLSAVWSLAVLLGSTTAYFESKTCSDDRTVTIQAGADAMMAGILGLRDSGTDFGCGVPAYSMQSYEALRFALELVNKKNETLNTGFLTDYYIPGIRLGMKVIDYCGRTDTAVAAVSKLFPSLQSDVRSCTPNQTQLTLGLVGTADSESTAKVSTFANKFNIPLVSYIATAVDLTYSGLYPNFQRTIPPDDILLEVMGQALVNLNWQYIVVVYQDSLYGKSAYASLRPILARMGICLTAAIAVSGNDVSPSTAQSVLGRIVNTDTVGVIYLGNSPWANALLENGKTVTGAGKLQWIFTDSISLETSFPNTNLYPRGILVIVPKSRYIVEFEDHWVRIDENNPPAENPWYARWYMEMNKCNLNGISTYPRACSSLYPDAAAKEAQRRSTFVQDQFVEPAVLAVFTYAAALRKAQQDLCGANYNGMCSSLREMNHATFLNSYLRKVDLTFTTKERIASYASPHLEPYNAAKKLAFNSKGDVVGPVFSIYNYNNLPKGEENSTIFRFREVGTYLAGKLSLSPTNVRMYTLDRLAPLPQAPPSLCPARGCSRCLGIPRKMQYYYAPGDIVINGVFSLHMMGVAKFTCGDLISKAHPLYLEAMIYAVKEVNNNPNILNNITLGGLGIDDCMDSTLSSNFIMQVQSGVYTVIDSNGVALDPRTVEAYTAAHTNSLTVPLAGLMDQYMQPMVGYRATSAVFDRYLYYMQTVPGIEDEFSAIIMIMKTYNWNYTQVVYNDDGYSAEDVILFRRMAAKAGICVVATHDLDSIVSVNVLAQQKTVRPVVLLLSSEGHRRFLQGIASAWTRSQNDFIATTTFSDDIASITSGLESVAEGYICIDLAYPDLTRFFDSLDSKFATIYQDNPWFEEWYEDAYQCNIGTDIPLRFASDCTSTSMITRAPSFHRDPRVFHVINAVKAIAYGLDKLLKIKCGPNYRGVCSEFVTASRSTKGADLVNEILSVSFSIDGSNPATNFQFDQRKWGGIYEYIIYNYRSGNMSRVGQVNPSTQVITTPGLVVNSTLPSCPQPCVQCLYTFAHQKYWYLEGDLIIPTIFDIHYQGQSPFYCGSLRAENSIQYTEAFRYALNLVNNGSLNVNLNGVRLGGLAFDGCTSSALSSAIITSVMGREFSIEDNNGDEVDVSKLISWMTYDSQSTVAAANWLKMIRMPIISPGAMTTELLDKTTYSTFFRTIPSDSVIVRAMVNLVKYLGKQYVVTLNAPDAESRAARDLFRTYMKAEGLCVIASFEYVSDGTVDVILQSINATGSTVVAVFADPSRYVPEMLRREQDMFPQVSKFLYISNRYWALERMNLALSASIVGNLKPVAANSLSFRLSASVLPDFIKYLQSLQWQKSDNPWLAEYYQALHRCDLGAQKVYNTPCLSTASTATLNSPPVSFYQDMFTLTTINAVHAVAVALKQVLEEKCGSSYSGVCGRFLTDSNTLDRLMFYMDKENFTDVSNILFRFIEREVDRAFDLMKHSNIRSSTADPFAVNVGTVVTNGAISYVPTFSTVDYESYKSECPDGCIACLGDGAIFREFSLLAGDLYIVGLFDVHTRGATPFTCGSINKEQGPQLLEAFNAAITYINQKQELFAGKLKGVRIGGIGIDVCQSPTRAANLVANIHSGNILIRLSGGTEINRRQIVAYVGPFDTHTTIRVADILNAIGIPQISYGASGLKLQDPKKYPYFLRSVPADDKQSRGIISYLKNFNMTNVQVVSSYETIGETMRAEFKRLATLNLVCIKKEYVVKDPYKEAAAIISQIVAPENAQSKVVILLVDNPLPILQAAGNNDLARTNFLWVATDKWGYDLNFLNKIKNLLGDRNTKRNVIIFDIETADVPMFEQYLDGKTPDNYKANPWFTEFYEDVFRCTWAGNGQMCDKTRGIPRAAGYIQDPFVLYVTNAVFSAGLAIDQTLFRICSDSNQNYDGLCLKFEVTGNRRDTVLEELRKVNFTDNTLQPFYYEPTGESSRGYHIYNVTYNYEKFYEGEYIYENVGSYNDTHFLKLDVTYNLTYDAYCKPYENCVCENPFPPKIPSRYMIKASPNELNLVYIGDIHQPSPTNPFACSRINTGSDFFKMMAFFYAINMVNTGNIYPESLRLGGIALDTCSTSLRLDQDIFNLLTGYPLCDTSNTAQIVPPSSVIAFVPDGNGNSIPVSRILASTGITSVSPSATSPQLREFVMSEHFLSIVPPDDLQATVLLQLLKQLNWDYASVIFSDDPSMVTAKNQLLKQSVIDQTACVGQAIVLPANAGITDADLALQQINQDVGARAVILFTLPAHTRLLLQAVKNRGQTGRFIWIGTSSWGHGNVAEMLTGLESQALGAIILQPRSIFLQSFRNYIKSLTFTNRQGIPDDWFEEIYQTLHQCKIHTIDNSLPYSTICTRREVITDSMVPFDATVLHTIIAVFMVAQGLNDVPSCQGTQLQVAACISSLQNKNNNIYQSILNAQWNVLPSLLGQDSFSFTFNDAGYGNIGFDIFNYRTSISGAGYTNNKLGSYTGNTLTLNTAKYSGISLYEEGRVPSSVCVGDECKCLGPLGVYGVASEWTYSPKASTVNVTVEGRTYYDPLTRQSYYVGKIPSSADRFNNMWGVALATLAALGVFISVALFIYLLIAYPVRGGTTVVGYLLAFGIILLYGMVFAFIAHASEQLCGLRRFCLGLCYSICYSAIFVKLVDSWRAKSKQDLYDIKYNKLGRPMGLFMVTVMLILVQVMINAEWLILVPPKVVRIFYYDEYWPRCAPDDFYDEGLVLSLCYIMFLIFLTIVMGLCSFNSTRNHREARWILGMAVLSVPTWVVWCAWSILGSIKSRDAAVAIGLLVNATILMLCGPVRKLYLLNKYQAIVEEERKELKADQSYRGDDYSTTGYDNQYDNAPQFHDRASGIGSTRGPNRYPPSSVRSGR